MKLQILYRLPKPPLSSRFMLQDSESLRIARECISTEAVARTKTLDLSNLWLTTLPAELSCLHHLQVLYCFGNPVSDLAPLADLTALQELDCSSTQVSDLSPLVYLTTLQNSGSTTVH